MFCPSWLCYRIGVLFLKVPFPLQYIRYLTYPCCFGCTDFNIFEQLIYLLMGGWQISLSSIVSLVLLEFWLAHLWPFFWVESKLLYSVYIPCQLTWQSPIHSLLLDRFGERYCSTTFYCSLWFKSFIVKRIPGSAALFEVVEWLLSYVLAFPDQWEVGLSIELERRVGKCFVVFKIGPITAGQFWPNLPQQVTKFH